MINLIEANLLKTLEIYPESTVKDSMTYSLMSGGKRIRPRLLLSLLNDLGGDMNQGLYPGCALEMIHTYSLVHDDLPAMDDDDMRRHKPTNHKVFGEAMAILGGDGLLTAAFTTLAQSDLNSDIKASCMEILARNAGSLGMILGQEYDIKNEIHNLDALIACYELKTGCLFASALEMATVIAGQPEKQTNAHDLGFKLGVCFQFQDDLLEVTKTSEEIGKSVQSDADREKVTIVSLLGLEKAQELTQSYFNDIESLLLKLELKDSYLKDLIEEMMIRNL